MAFVSPCVPPEVLAVLERNRATLSKAFSDATADYPERLAAFRDALQEHGFDPESSSSLTEVLFDHLLAATLGRGT